ncbi:MAG: hypothetical protein KAQ62_28855 [Cyclobacteriaceae bacterium]|nr:hypothetical protein [Cyclobacteriaceae bacterium]MCK5207721.1 hypothetical protein [Cyclobacteriaceae bacterium]MCK5277120.1 hypothetical protein [Cyclobacteriaceae bacterium]MCK5372621.1 hypothetical protein [Cyclobacteriaceae bacterium]MCK5468734.1 hypothetical protein [Cyclobacteriaceae bacterium]
MRLRLSDYFIHYTSILEEEADKIYFGTNNLEIKRAALMWKIYGISAMNKAINMPDPIASFYNAWPFTKQIIIFFEEGEGKEKFGPFHKDAVQLSRYFESKLDTILIDMTDIANFDLMEPQIDNWVAEHYPIQDFYFTRESTLEDFARWLGEEHLGLGKSVVTITEEVKELSNKINLYTDLVPRQARWQIDYAILNYLQDTTLTSRIDKLITSMDRITKVIEMTPDVIEYNRDATLRDIDEQREKSLQFLIGERKAFINEIRKERVEVISKIIAERKAVLEELKNERAIVLEEIKGMSSDLVLQTGSEIERIVDKIFWRLTLISIIIGLSLILSVVLYKKL